MLKKNCDVSNFAIESFRITGGALFSFGSVLLWAYCKNLLPKNNGVATFVGITTGMALVKLTSDYLEDVDSQVD
jgi:hypothetical protein